MCSPLLCLLPLRSATLTSRHRLSLKGTYGQRLKYCAPRPLKVRSTFPTLHCAPPARTYPDISKNLHIPVLKYFGVALTFPTSTCRTHIRLKLSTCSLDTKLWLSWQMSSPQFSRPRIQTVNGFPTLSLCQTNSRPVLSRRNQRSTYPA